MTKENDLTMLIFYICFIDFCIMKRENSALYCLYVSLDNFSVNMVLFATSTH